jgi:Glycosyl transferase 4-like domain
VNPRPPEAAKKVLIASYYFPPDSAVGGLRAEKFVRELPAFGWEPVVLTVKGRGDDLPPDPERLEGLSSFAIVRTRELPGWTNLYLWIKSRIRKRGSVRPPALRNANSVNAAAQAQGLGSSLKRYVVSLLVLLPDQEKGWSLFAAITAVRLIRKRHVDCVITSAPPMSLHFIGLLVKALTDAKWIADFRDPWLESLDGRPAAARSSLADAIEAVMERSVVKHADIIVTTTDRMAEALRERYRELGEKKVVCLPNSIDSDKFASVAPPKYEPFTITYAGTLYEGRTPEPLFQAVGRLIREGRISAAQIRIKLVGQCALIEGVDTRVVARRHGVESVVEVAAPLPYSDVIRIMQQSHLLLVLSPAHHRLAIPAKLYDYLGSGSKILGIAEAGAATDLIDETNSGRWFSHADVDGLSDYLASVIASREFASLKNDAASFRRFDVSFLAGHLAEHMSSLCNGGLAPARARGH